MRLLWGEPGNEAIVGRACTIVGGACTIVGGACTIVGRSLHGTEDRAWKQGYRRERQESRKASNTIMYNTVYPMWFQMLVHEQLDMCNQWNMAH